MDISFLQEIAKNLLNQMLCLCLHFCFRIASSQEGHYHIINCGNCKQNAFHTILLHQFLLILLVLLVCVRG
jgi:hypothetical protein